LLAGLNEISFNGYCLAEISESKDPVRQGYVENSNVASMTEMVRLVETMRHFESAQKVIQGYDEMLEKSLQILKPGGKLISISGPPDPEFAEEIKAPWFLQQVMRVLSFGTRRKANRRNIRYSFLFMKAGGSQLQQITSLIEAGVIRPVVDRVFPFESTEEALTYIETGRAKGKVVGKVK